MTTSSSFMKVSLFYKPIYNRLKIKYLNRSYKTKVANLFQEKKVKIPFISAFNLRRFNSYKIKLKPQFTPAQFWLQVDSFIATRKRR